MILCQVYKSSRKTEMYLYVEMADGLGTVPQELMRQFGKASLVMSMKLDESRKLARVDVVKVLAALEEDGYFLQMPPTPDQLAARYRHD